MDDSINTFRVHAYAQHGEGEEPEQLPAAPCDINNKNTILGWFQAEVLFLLGEHYVDIFCRLIIDIKVTNKGNIKISFSDAEDTTNVFTAKIHLNGEQYITQLLIKNFFNKHMSELVVLFGKMGITFEP